MQSSCEREIRAWLARYLAAEISLRAFEEWFIPLTWVRAPGEDRACDDLANEIELRLAEFTSGHWTEQELRELLGTLAGRSSVA